MKENERNESEGFLFPALFSSQEKENKERERDDSDDDDKAYAPAREETVSAPAGSEDIDVGRFIQFFNSRMPPGGIPKIVTVRGSRLSCLHARCREYGKSAVVAMVERASRSFFLNGGGATGWHADIDWLLRPNIFPRVVEGIYDDYNAYSPKHDAQAARRARNRELYEAICREQRQAREQMSQGAVTYEEYQRLKAQGLVPDAPPEA